MAEKSAIQRIKGLDAERALLFEQTKEEALKKAIEAITDLIALPTDQRRGQASKDRVRKSPGNRQGRTLSSLPISHNPASRTGEPIEVKKRKRHFPRLN
jgi:hypothetical protein